MNENNAGESASLGAEREEYRLDLQLTLQVFAGHGLTRFGPKTLALIKQEVQDVRQHNQVAKEPLSPWSEVFKRVVWKVAGVDLMAATEAEQNRYSFWEKIGQKLASY